MVLDMIRCDSGAQHSRESVQSIAAGFITACSMCGSAGWSLIQLHQNMDQQISAYCFLIQQPLRQPQCMRTALQNFAHGCFFCLQLPSRKQPKCLLILLPTRSNQNLDHYWYMFGVCDSPVGCAPLPVSLNRRD